MAMASGGWRLSSHGLTDVGLVCQRNEDNFLDRPERGLWAVADGMGGHEAGDYASRRIVAALDAILPPERLDRFGDLVEARLRAVDGELRARAARLGPGAVIASTVVVLLARPPEIAWLWAGDSRLYRMRGGILAQLTVDHSRVQELVSGGLLRPEAAAGHPDAHVVTQAIGGGRLAFGRSAEALRRGDRFLLCSDGLTNMVGDAEIARELASAPPRAAAERLLDSVLRCGAVDNVTIVIIAAEEG